MYKPAFAAHRMRGGDAARLDRLGAQPAAFQRLQAELAVADGVAAHGRYLDYAALAFSELYSLGH